MNEENKIKLLIEISVLSNKAAMCYQLRMPEDGKKAEDECVKLVNQIISERPLIPDYADIAEYF